ncbi:MAG: sodium:solute symporter, partial [Pirellulales bacterium]|nr:sodium:solute symporter [Pirellulales bacterium]
MKIAKRILRRMWLAILALAVASAPAAACAQKLATRKDSLDWSRLPDLPDKLGVAGPFVGVHADALIVAGGANFPRPVWDKDKVWHDRIHVLTKSAEGYVWMDGGRLPRALAYGAAVSTPGGIVCMGGNDASTTFQDVFLLQWDQAAGTMRRTPYPDLPKP